MAKSLRLFLLALCWCLATNTLYAQTPSMTELNLTLGEQRVRFAPMRSFQEMRLEIVNHTGEVVFTHTTSEAEFDWNLRAGNGEALRLYAAARVRGLRWNTPVALTFTSYTLE